MANSTVWKHTDGTRPRHPVTYLIMRSNGVLVAKRARDGWLSASHILELAGYRDREKRSILSKRRRKKWTKDEFEIVTKQAQNTFKGTWITPVQSVILAQEYDVYQPLLPLFQYPLEEPEVEPSDAYNPDDAHSESDCSDPDCSDLRLDPEVDEKVPKRRASESNDFKDFRRHISPANEKGVVVISPSPELRETTERSKKRRKESPPSDDGEKSEDPATDIRRLRRLLDLQKELVDTDLVDKNNNEALDGVVRAVTKRCLDNEKTLAAVTSFLVQDRS